MTREPQAGAIPYRRGQGGIQYLLITSTRGNWIFPKGYVDDGETLEITAAKETREEAGVQGRVIGPSLGSFKDTSHGHDTVVHFFLLEVDGEVVPWAEAHFRQRRWCGFDEARARLKRGKHRKMLDRARDRLGELAATGAEAETDPGPGTVR